MANISELEFGEAFIKHLKDNPTPLSFEAPYYLVPELAVERGRPDYVLVEGLTPASARRIPPLIESDARILAELNANSPRRTAYLSFKTGLTERTVNDSIRRLDRAGLIKRTSTQSIVSTQDDCTAKTRTTAFEFKLSKPRRAFFQAQQYCSFADRVFIVVPPDSAKGFAELAASLRVWGIGLVGFDPDLDILRVIYRGRLIKHAVRWPNIYAVAQVGEFARSKAYNQHSASRSNENS